MSLMGSIQAWLQEYPGMELRPLGEVLTDLTKGVRQSYALAPAGDGKTTEDIGGNHTYLKNYVFYACESMTDERDRAENHDFLEGFAQWLEDCAEQGAFPQLPGGYTVDSVEVSNLLLYDVNSNGSGIYQVQIQLTITKWRARSCLL